MTGLRVSTRTEVSAAVLTGVRFGCGRFTLGRAALFVFTAFTMRIALTFFMAEVLAVTFAGFTGGSAGRCRRTGRR